MVFLDEFLPIIIYILLIVLITILIIIAIKVNKTMDKVDNIADNIDGKLKSLDPAFDLVEGVTTKAGLISDKFLGFILNIVNKLFKSDKRKDKEEE